VTKYPVTLKYVAVPISTDRRLAMRNARVDTSTLFLFASTVGTVDLFHTWRLFYTVLISSSRIISSVPETSDMIASTS